MFTGIVLGCAEVVTSAPSIDITRLSIAIPTEWSHGLEIGASVAINGACLTVVAIESGIVSFDLIPETLAKTNLGSLKPKDLVHVERALKVGDEIGGHLLSGHIYGMATLLSRQSGTFSQQITLQVPNEWMVYIQPKGYIAVDGVSLTIVDTMPNAIFTIQLIPETLKRTTLGQKEIGSRLNIEIDSNTQLIVETVRRFLKQS